MDFEGFGLLFFAWLPFVPYIFILL